MEENYLKEGGVAAIVNKYGEVFHIFGFRNTFDFIKQWTNNNIKTGGENSRSKIFKQFTLEEREECFTTQLFSVKENKSSVKIISDRDLKLITYAFIQFFKPKYTIAGIDTIFEIPETCYPSTGEKLIEKWLQDHDIPYEREFAFNDLRGDYEPLRFDFKIKNHKILIEFQGKHHYRPIEPYGGEKEFEKIVRYDNLKREYCGENDYHLIEIPYNFSDLNFYLNILLL